MITFNSALGVLYHLDTPIHPRRLHIQKYKWIQDDYRTNLQHLTTRSLNFQKFTKLSTIFLPVIKLMVDVVVTYIYSLKIEK